MRDQVTEPKHFLITGGSGFLGINLIRYLLERGHKITSLDIEPFTYEDCKDEVNDILGDIRDLEMVEKAMEGVDIVIHTAAALPLYTPEEIYTTDIDGTRNVIETALKFGVERFNHISSTAVYGIPDHHPLYEYDPVDGVGPYGESKVKAEEIVAEYRDKGMIVTIIRPKSFVGPERLGIFAIFYEWAMEGRNFPMIGNGKNRYQLLDVEDLCDAIYLCAILPEAQVNDTFNIGAKEYTTMKEDYQAVLDEAGFGKRIVTFPDMPVIYTLRILEALKLSPLYKWIYETASKDSFVSIEKAEEKLNWAPQYSNKTALVRNYHWYLENHQNIAKRTGVSHRVPWKQGVLKIVKLFF